MPQENSLDSPSYAYDLELEVRNHKNEEYVLAKVKTDKYGDGTILLQSPKYYHSRSIYHGIEIPISLRGKGKSKSCKKVRSLVLWHINQKEEYARYCSSKKVLEQNKRVFSK